MGKDDCKGGHDCHDENHLCKLAKKENGVARVRELVRDPRFICGKCGRVAREATRLCRPEGL